jgi:hypothetical protein
MLMYRLAVGAVLALVLLLPGCAKKQPPKEEDVAGRAEKADGKPLSKVLLRFHAQDEARTVSCPTKDDGTFECRCLPGRYKVTVLAIPTQSGGSPGTGGIAAPATGSLAGVPSAYTSPTDTPLEVTIPEGGKKDIELKLK